MTVTDTTDTALSAPHTSPPPAVCLDSVTKSFGSVTAVADLSLQIQPGEVVALLGPNGAGKTTTIDMILGLARATGGDVQIFGREPHAAISAGMVSAVMQTGGLLKDYTVRETIEAIAALFGLDDEIDAVIQAVMDRAGITHIADRRVAKCSGGEQQRLRFAMALLPDPDILILDEPTTGMDVAGRREFWSSIQHDAEHGRTIIFATHYLEEADAYADRIVLVNEGRVVADGSAREIKAVASGRKVRATLQGASGAGLLDVPGVDSAVVHSDSVELQCSDSDAVARYLLNHTEAKDIEITARNLEDAFVTLTSSQQSEGDHT